MSDRPTLVFHFLSSWRETSAEDDKDDDDGGWWCSGTNAMSYVSKCNWMVRLWIFHLCQFIRIRFAVIEKSFHAKIWIFRTLHVSQWQRKAISSIELNWPSGSDIPEEKQKNMYVWQLSLPTMTDHHHRRHFATLLIPHLNVFRIRENIIAFIVSFLISIATTIGFISLGRNTKLVAQSSIRIQFHTTEKSRLWRV